MMNRRQNMCAAVALAGAVALAVPAALAQPAPPAPAQDHEAHHPAEPLAQAPAAPPQPQPGAPAPAAGMPMPGAAPGQGGMMMDMGQMMPMMMPMMRGGMPMMGMMGQAPTAQGPAGPGTMPGGMGGPAVAPAVALRGRNLTADEVRRILDGLLAWYGHTRLQVGEVKAADANTVIADIATKDGSLVERIKVDLRTGRMNFAD